MGSWCFILAFLWAADGHVEISPVPESERRFTGTPEFIFVTEQQTKSPAFGVVMECPSHAHGTPEEAEVKLKALLQNSSVAVPTLAVCRADQIATLEHFCPLVDRAVVNPFVLGHCTADGDRNRLPWPDQEHPRFDRLRAVRSSAGTCRLLAIVNLTGECHKLACTLGDIKWMVSAAIGSGFQGVVWRGNRRDEPLGGALDAYEKLFRPYSKILGAAKLVDWIQEHDGALASALLSGETLVVVLLDPEYMTYASSKTYKLALAPPVKRVSVTLDLDEGYEAVSARSLEGRAIRVAGGVFHCMLSGGSDIIFIKLKRSAVTVGDRPHEEDASATPAAAHKNGAGVAGQVGAPARIDGAQGP